jgi:hypothetical protein
LVLAPRSMVVFEVIGCGCLPMLKHARTNFITVCGMDR